MHFSHPMKLRFYKEMIQSLISLNTSRLATYFQRFYDVDQEGLTITLNDGRKVECHLISNFRTTRGHFDFETVDKVGTPILEYQKKIVLVYANYFARYFNEHDKAMREELNIFQQDIYLNHNVFRVLRSVLNAIAEDLIHSRKKLDQIKGKTRTEMLSAYQQTQKPTSFKTASDPVYKKEILKFLTIALPPDRDGLGRWLYAPAAHTFWLKVLKKEEFEILINEKAAIYSSYTKTNVPFTRLFTFKPLKSGTGHCLIVPYEDIYNYYIQAGYLKPIKEKPRKSL